MAEMLADSTLTSKGNHDTATLLQSRDSSVHKDYASAKANWFDFSSVSLRQVCFALHSILIGVHLALLGIRVRHLEHRAVFPLADQNVVSFCITAITNVFTTTYCALLVWVTQSLAMRQALQTQATLTSIHDTTAAWSGIGSGILALWSQRSVRASVSGVLRAVLYLGTIMAVQDTMPALFSLQTFNSTTSLPVVTQSLPNYTFQDVTRGPLADESFLANVTSLSTQILGLLPFLENLTTLGLEGKTLYDVPPVNTGLANVAVNATTLNITCGYLPRHNVTTGLAWEYDKGGPGQQTFYLPDTQPGVVVNMCTTGINDCISDSIWLYSTIPIIDSHGDRGPIVPLNPPMNSSVSEVQLLRCMQSLVSQSAMVDSQSRSLRSLLPVAEKVSSTWFPFPENAPDPTSYESAFPLLLSYAMWHNALPGSDVPLDGTGSLPFLSVGDEYLVQKLNLLGNSPPPHLLLHEVEDALANLTAAIFWLVGHIPPLHKPLVNVVTSTPDKWTHTQPFFLSEGHVAVMELSVETRLNLNIIAILTGLVSAITLTALILPLLFRPDADMAGSGDWTYGTGFLHAIWLYRNDPELKEILPQVDDPTEDNLRAAGMVRFQSLAQGQSKKKRTYV
ncbi:hypothetical protein C8R43DRAFT_344838 [Mycena crocata]|nr:hypothetical protein C8R43DRAFT_344838 [Mycena crocata]